MCSSIGNVFSDAHDEMRIFRLPKGTMSIFENMLLPSHISRWACPTTNRPQLPTSRLFQIKESVADREHTKLLMFHPARKAYIIQVHEYYVCLQLGHWPFWHRFIKFCN
jgi:hypothetical protein